MSSNTAAHFFMPPPKKYQWKFHLLGRDARLVRPKCIRVFCRITNCKKDARTVRPYRSIAFLWSKINVPVGTHGACVL